MAIFYLCELEGVPGAGKYVVAEKKQVNDGQSIIMSEGNYYNYEDSNGAMFVVQIRSIGMTEERLTKMAAELLENELSLQLQFPSTQENKSKAPSSSSLTSSQGKCSTLDGSEFDMTQFDEGGSTSNSQLDLVDSQVSDHSQSLLLSPQPRSTRRGGKTDKPSLAKSTRESRKVLQEWSKNSQDDTGTDDDDYADDFPVVVPKGRGTKRKTVESTTENPKKKPSLKKGDTGKRGDDSCHDEVTALRKENRELQQKVWALENENSELLKKTRKSSQGTDSEKLDLVLGILQNAFPVESAERDGNDKVILGKVEELNENGQALYDASGKVVRGEVGIYRTDYNIINFLEPLKAVKDLAVGVFGFGTLQTHTLSGRKSNAHKDGITKPKLNEKKVNLIIGHVMRRFKNLKSSNMIYDQKLQVERPLQWGDLEQAIRDKCHAASKSNNH